MKNILFVEGAPYIRYSADPASNIGGSAVCLETIVRNLTTEEFRAVVLFSYPSVHARALAERSIDVTVAPPKLPPEKPAKPFRSLAPSEARLKRSYGKSFVLRIIPQAFRLRRFIREKRIDLVHANMSLALDAAAVIAARMANVPCVCHVRSFDTLYGIHRILARSVDAFVFMSEALRKSYEDQGIPSPKTSVIHSGVDLRDYPADPPAARSSPGFVVAQFGRMIEWKGFQTLLDAVPLLRREVGSVRVLCVGGGPMRTLLRDQAERLGIGDIVEFREMTPDIRPDLASADVVVLPSLKPEPFGQIVLEAMACGKPVVAADHGGPREIITDGRDGMLFPPGDAAGLADRLARLAEDESLRIRLGRNARRTIEERFDHREANRGLENLFRSLT